VSAFTAAHLDDIAAEKWPYWELSEWETQSLSPDA
jgi:hypothetical protein